MIRISEKDILFTAINIVMFIFSVVYLILFTFGKAFMLMAREYVPLQESGINVLLAFCEMGFVLALVLVVLVDVWWVFRSFKKWYRQYRRENL